MKHTNILKDIMFDQYGNYVVQAVFQAAKEFEDQAYFQFFMKVRISSFLFEICLDILHLDR
jgi:hypothetical protein